MAGEYLAEFATDGSGKHRIYLPADADKHDVLALGPVLKAMREFVEPTIEPEKPIGYQLVEAIEPPDLTA